VLRASGAGADNTEGKHHVQRPALEREQALFPGCPGCPWGTGGGVCVVRGSPKSPVKNAITGYWFLYVYQPLIKANVAQDLHIGRSAFTDFIQVQASLFWYREQPPLPLVTHFWTDVMGVGRVYLC
jgi:hypothetical protein